MAKKNGIDLPSYTPEGLQEEVFKPTYNNLGEYLRGFQYTCNVLRSLENIERASYELAIDNQKEGVNYIEVRFAPQLLVDLTKNLDFESILTAAYKGLERAKKEYNNGPEVKEKGKPEFHYGIISCAMRMFGPKGFSPYYSNLYQMMSFSRPGQIIRFAAMEMVRACVKLRDEKGLPIVGIDLAGQEEGYPAGKFSEAYADRIGHGYSLFMPERIKDPNIQDKDGYIKNLASFIADKRTVIEVCLTSNMQTNPELSKVTEHKFKNMLDNRMATTICTDNRLVSNTTVTKEYQLALDNFEIPLKRLKDIVAYGFKKSFFPGSYVEKRAYAKLNMQYFDKIVEEYLSP